MTTSGDQPASRLKRAVGWARKAPAKRVGTPVGAVALAISGAFGGWAPVQTSYDEATFGEAVETGPLDVSVERIRAIDTMSPFASPDEGNRLLVVVATVRNPTDEPVHHITLTQEMDIEVAGAERDAVGLGDLARREPGEALVGQDAIGLGVAHE